jgi:tRNA1(Val) A37 N6-methylase TrmN6
MEITAANNSHSRVKGNELAKGYYPTFPKDVEMIKSAISIEFGYDQKSINEKKITVFDPCAGEGTFLNAMVRHARRASDLTCVKNTSVCSYAIELDADRFKKINRVDQKLNASFFETTTSGPFDLVLLNPPYNKNAKELTLWIDKAAPMVSTRGLMVLIIPEYELKGELITLLRGNFKYRYACRSEEYDAFKQVVIFLNKRDDNELSRIRYRHVHYDNLDNTPEDPIQTFKQSRLSLSIRGDQGDKPRPLLQCLDLSEFYLDCAARLETATRIVLDKIYPSVYDTSILPASTLRTAHAVQLAAMNSQVESICINGAPFLAKYMVVQKADSYESCDEGVKTTTTVFKPSVETFLMDRTGTVTPAVN